MDVSVEVNKEEENEILAKLEQFSSELYNISIQNENKTYVSSRELFHIKYLALSLVETMKDIIIEDSPSQLQSISETSSEESLSNSQTSSPEQSWSSVSNSPRETVPPLIPEMKKDESVPKLPPLASILSVVCSEFPPLCSPMGLSKGPIAMQETCITDSSASPFLSPTHSSKLNSCPNLYKNTQMRWHNYDSMTLQVTHQMSQEDFDASSTKIEGSDEQFHSNRGVYFITEGPTSQVLKQKEALRPTVPIKKKKHHKIASRKIG